MSGIKFAGIDKKAVLPRIEKCFDQDKLQNLGFNTAMFNTTRFAQILKPHRDTFQKLTDLFQADKHTKHFTLWQQLIVMIYGHLSQANSLRQLVCQFNQHYQHHYHLGVSKTLKRSTLAEANQQKSIQPLIAFAQTLMSQLHPKEHQELKQLTYLIDSSPIQLLGQGFDWSKTGSRIKGLKLHLQLELSQKQPTYFEITDANVSDIVIGKKLATEKGATYVMDRGYHSYHWWLDLHNQGITLITRPRNNARFEILNDFSSEIDPQSPVISDQRVKFKNKQPLKTLDEMQLRLVTVEVENKPKPLVIVTNDFQRSAQEIADLYKQRWQIELFFKWIKSRLKIKRFWGQSRNAVQFQLLSALISYLLIKLESKTKSTWGAFTHEQIDKLSLNEFWQWNMTNLFGRPEQEASYWRRKAQREAYEELQFKIPGLGY